MIRALVLAAALAIPTVADAAPIRCDRFGCGGPTLQKQWNHNVTARHGARPRGCPRAWCGCWLALKIFGTHKRQLWLARNWLKIGRRIARPRPGAIAVFARGRRGGHVGVVTKVINRRTIVLLSGNDGRRVRERPRSTRNVIAYRVL